MNKSIHKLILIVNDFIFVKEYDLSVFSKCFFL